MHSFLSRANNISTVCFTALGAAVFLVFLQTYHANYTTPVEIAVSDFKVRQVKDRASVTGRSDYATMYFSLHGDLTPVFNWNVKMLYVFLVASFNTPERPLSEITLWDKYYKRFENVNVHEVKISPHFDFLDDGTHFLQRNVTFKLRWTVVPNSGYMRNVDAEGEVVLPTPKSYNW